MKWDNCRGVSLLNSTYIILRDTFVFHKYFIPYVELDGGFISVVLEKKINYRIIIKKIYEKSTKYVVAVCWF